VEAARYAAPGETGCFFPPARHGSGDRLADAPFTIDPKCLEGSHNTYDRSTNSSRMQHRSSSNSRDGHSSTHDTRKGSSQKHIHGATINGTPSPTRCPPFTIMR